MPSSEQLVKIEGRNVPFKVFVERRRSIRVSFGKSAILLRLPSNLSERDKEVQFLKAVNWVKSRAVKNPDVLLPYVLEDYDKKPSFFVYGKEFGLSISYAERQSGKASFDNSTKTVFLILPLEVDGPSKNKMIKQLLSRICGKIFLPEIKKRVNEINDQCFYKKIKSIRLKYNASNWGSCSSKGNVNLSTRLLFAPKDIIDYVIIHELSHLYEMNHSPKFWNIVSQVMPNYKEKEQWLSVNGKLCDF